MGKPAAHNKSILAVMAGSSTFALSPGSRIAALETGRITNITFANLLNILEALDLDFAGVASQPETAGA